MKTTIMYMKGSCIISVNAFLLLLLLLSSCGKNRDISEFVVDPPHETKVEYMKDTIKLTDKYLYYPTMKDDVTILIKKNGKYYLGDLLFMSTEKDTSYILPELDRIFRIKRMCVIRKIGENLYSNKIYTEIEPHHWEIAYAFYYDKSYRIIKFQDMVLCDFILKK